MKKNIILLGASLVFILAFFSLSCYKFVLENRLLNAWPQFLLYKEHPDLEDRQKMRWQGPYLFCKTIQQEFAQHNIEDPVLLIAPSDYFHKHGMKLNVPEPLVVYYFCGIRSVEVTSDNVTDARYVVYPVNGKLHLAPINSVEELQNYLTLFKS